MSNSILCSSQTALLRLYVCREIDWYMLMHMYSPTLPSSSPGMQGSGEKQMSAVHKAGGGSNAILCTHTMSHTSMSNSSMPPHIILLSVVLIPSLCVSLRLYRMWLLPLSLFPCPSFRISGNPVIRGNVIITFSIQRIHVERHDETASTHQQLLCNGMSLLGSFMAV